MLRNGRPYTVENGWIDDGLLTAHSNEEITQIGEWIRKNIRRSNRVLKCHSSYGIKHLLQKDTGIYLTNNEFKDAMLLAGYAPVEANELNWHYRIVLVRECNTNPGPFFNWARKFLEDESMEGDFVREMVRDFDFPVFADHDIIENYLLYEGACDGALESFESLWRMYEREEH